MTIKDSDYFITESWKGVIHFLSFYKVQYATVNCNKNINATHTTHTNHATNKQKN